MQIALTSGTLVASVSDSNFAVHDRGSPTCVLKTGATKWVELQPEVCRDSVHTVGTLLSACIHALPLCAMQGQPDERESGCIPLLQVPTDMFTIASCNGGQTAYLTGGLSNTAANVRAVQVSVPIVLLPAALARVSPSLMISLLSKHQQHASVPAAASQRRQRVT